ncbi:hypothetical protein NLI96_g4743 [Meripilus lineatus]|uniref:Replication factor A protein 3 n=1 Tax=Meripilus lineatus TaxID=2056292 RepID=A0AAD5YFF5_9APHY|nr:hypothetical protein NLI96_g4743 [Physisporinus lineatus]
MSDAPTPRVNSARLGDYIGRTVRLTGKYVGTRRDSNTGQVAFTVEASDGGNVDVIASYDNEVRDPYIEVIGRVKEAAVMTLDAVVNLGDKLDLTVVDFVVEKWHSPQFTSMFFGSQK